MVSLWPWKREDLSPESFEKALSKLSEQIQKSSVRLDASRARSRRVKALWLLSTSIAYILYTLILALVLGINKWSVAHFGGVLGAPVIIFVVNRLTMRFYEWRISSQQAYLEDLQKQRETTIERLKAATKYNSTLELLNKYGATPTKSSPQSGPAPKKKSTPTPNPQNQPPVRRTGIAPPPTANIPGRSPPPPSTPRSPSEASLRQDPASAPSAPSSPPNVPFPPDEPGFAPNAFSTYPQPSQFQTQAPRWYDRFLDVLLGEDETLPKNRMALICSKCRLVNGQAPPGMKSLDDLGKWRCGGCGAWNGEESEARKVLEAVRQKEERDRKEGWEVVSKGDEIKDEDDRGRKRDVISSEDDAEEIPAKPVDEPEPELEEQDEAEEEEKKRDESPTKSSGTRKRTTRSGGKRK